VAISLKLFRNGAVGFIGWLDVWRDFIELFATSKRNEENNRATDNEDDCEPHQRTGIRQNGEATTVTTWTPSDAR